jgi:hypothetical protein
LQPLASGPLSASLLASWALRLARSAVVVAVEALALLRPLAGLR